MVNDFAGFLNSSEKKSLEEELKGYQNKTGKSIVITSLDSLTDPQTKKLYTIEEAALLYFNTWGIGDNVFNYGVLFMITKTRQIRIEVSRGLEEVLTNKFCKKVIDSSMVPDFKKGLFFSGLKKGIKAVEYKLNNPPPIDMYKVSDSLPR